MEILILALLGVWLALALRSTIRHKGGCGSSGCSGCCDHCDACRR